MVLKQQTLLKPSRKNTKKWWIESAQVYGGALEYRKCSRPFHSKKLTHAVFKARLAQSMWFTKSQKSIEKLLRNSLQKYDLKLKSFSIQRDHIHVLFYSVRSLPYFVTQEKFQNFLKFFPAEMGRKYAQIYEGLGIEKVKSLWEHRPFTRLVSWGKKSLEKVMSYIEKNTLEASGVIKYEERDHALNQFLRKWKLASFAQKAVFRCQ